MRPEPGGLFEQRYWMGEPNQSDQNRATGATSAGCLQAQGRSDERVP